MTHRATQIRERVIGLLTGLPTTEMRVGKGDVNPQRRADFPGIRVHRGSDDPRATENSFQFLDCVLIMNVWMAVQGDPDTLDDQLEQMHAEVEEALLVDPTLGLSFVIDTVTLGTTDPDRTSDGVMPTAAMAAVYEIHYRRSREDPRQ